MRARLADLDDLALRPVAVGVGERIDGGPPSTGIARLGRLVSAASPSGLAELGRTATAADAAAAIAGAAFRHAAGTAGTLGSSFSRAASIDGSFSSFQTWSGIFGRLQGTRDAIEAEHARFSLELLHRRPDLDDGDHLRGDVADDEVDALVAERGASTRRTNCASARCRKRASGTCARIR